MMKSLKFRGNNNIIKATIIMNYYDEIDPIGQESNECINCGAPTLKTYCCRECKDEHNE